MTCTRFAVVAAVLLGAATPARAQLTPACQIGTFDATSSTFHLDADGDGGWSAGDRSVPVDAAGGPGAAALVGDWNGDGRDDLGNQRGTWYRVDLDGDGVWEGNAGGDRSTNFAGSYGAGIPIVGRWSASGGDRIGTYVPSSGRFLLDTNGNGIWDGSSGGDTISSFGAFKGPGKPAIGDWDGDGDDDLGLFISTKGFLIDLNGNGAWDGQPIDRYRMWFYLGPLLDFPLVGDWDLDGRDDLARYFNFEGIGWIQFLNDLGVGVPLVCDWDGDGTENIGKVTIGTSFWLDTNGNGYWDGNAGGDRSTGFAPPGPVGAPIAGRFAP